eukprot:Skav229218  [mRNA]  locus=scaffold2439:128885:129696:- [translate_table: standard]
MSRWLRQHQTDLPNTRCFQQLSFLGEDVLALLQNLLQLSVSVVEQRSVGDRREGVLSQHHMQKVQGHRGFASLQSPKAGRFFSKVLSICCSSGSNNIKPCRW